MCNNPTCTTNYQLPTSSGAILLWCNTVLVKNLEVEVNCMREPKNFRCHVNAHICMDCPVDTSTIAFSHCQTLTILHLYNPSTMQYQVHAQTVSDQILGARRYKVSM